MGKRANGEGTILPYKVKGVQKGWRTSIMIGFKPDGKPDRKQFYGKTQKEVKEKLEDYKRKMSMGVLNEENITIQDWFYTWLFDYRKQDLKPKSFDRYHGIYKNYILNTNLGKIKLCDLRTTHLQRHYKNLLDQGVTPTTIKQLNTNLKTCLGEAERQGYILKNWCKLVTLPKIDNDKEIKVLTPEEQTKFLAAIKGHELELLFIVALGTGLRLGELLGLKWCDIDFKNNELTVNRSIQRVPIYEGDKIVRYEVIEQTPKTKNSSRTISVPVNIINKLKKYKKEQNQLILYAGEAYTNNNYVLCNKLGKIIDDKKPGRNLKSILKKLDIEPMKFHALRHTYATRLFEAGVAPKTVQHLMGHADIQTTMNIYTHVMKGEKIEAVDKINNLFVEV